VGTAPTGPHDTGTQPRIANGQPPWPLSWRPRPSLAAKSAGNEVGWVRENSEPFEQLFSETREPNLRPRRAQNSTGRLGLHPLLDVGGDGVGDVVEFGMLL
jgi:hypothetical protein